MTKERVCVICGRPFTYERGRPVTCGPQCSRRRKTEVAAERRAMVECPPDKHGTLDGWSNYHCDCDKCREHQRTYRRELRRQQTEN